MHPLEVCGTDHGRPPQGTTWVMEGVACASWARAGLASNWQLPCSCRVTSHGVGAVQRVSAAVGARGAFLKATWGLLLPLARVRRHLRLLQGMPTCPARTRGPHDVTTQGDLSKQRALPATHVHTQCRNALHGSVPVASVRLVRLPGFATWPLLLCTPPSLPASKLASMEQPLASRLCASPGGGGGGWTWLWRESDLSSVSFDSMPAMVLSSKVARRLAWLWSSSLSQAHAGYTNWLLRCRRHCCWPTMAPLQVGRQSFNIHAAHPFRHCLA